jgi:hypothetical protein
VAAAQMAILRSAQALAAAAVLADSALELDYR